MEKARYVRLQLAVLVLSVGLAFGACQKKEPTAPGGLLSDLQKEYGSKSAGELISQFEGQLNEYDRTISELTAQARGLDGQAKEEINKNVEAFKTQRDEAVKRIEDLKSPGSTTFGDVLRYVGLEEAYKKIIEVVNLFR